MKHKWLIGIVSCASMLLGGIATLASNWADDRRTEELIDEKIKEALAERDEDDKS